MQEIKDRFRSLYPTKYFLDTNNIEELEDYLHSNNLIESADKVVSCSSPGAGNMNFVTRVITQNKSLILKQSRPWVEKYPTIDAPEKRVNTEAAFYKAVSKSEALKQYSPEIYFHDQDNFMLVMSDLGDVSDFSFLYKIGSKADDDSITSLSDYLSQLHSLDVSEFPDNLEMRKLNHEHIFNFPFQSGNGFNLEDIQIGLSKITVNEKSDPKLVKEIAEIGELYLSNGDTLLHGDYYPGSWMKSDSLYVIDPEFSFKGPKEFDLGVFIAHMKMALQHDEKIELFLSQYRQTLNFDKGLVLKFAGIEILRRLLGVAQLPLELSVIQKSKLVTMAKDWIAN